MGMGFTRVCCDSRAAHPGDLFVALRGARTDGHRHVQEAVERGALALVIEKGRLEDIPAPLRHRVAAAVDDSRLALAHLAADFHGHPSRRLFTVGITGTNGKTTVASLVEHIWNSAPAPPRGGGCGFIGTVGIRTGRDVFPSELTTPEAPDLQAALARMWRAGMRGAVIEVSSQGISHHRIAGTAFAVAALTQITPDHSDIHPSFEAYRDLKLGFLRRQPRRTRLVVNADDREAAPLLREPSYPERLFTYGTAPLADLRIASIRQGPTGLQLHLIPSRRLLGAMGEPEWERGAGTGGTFPSTAARRAVPGTVWRLATPLLGRHNAHNVAAAALIALLAGVGPGAVAEGVRTFRGPERRLRLHTLKGRWVLDDTAMNPASYEAAFETARALGLRPSGGRYILVCAIRGSRGPAVNAQNGAVIARWAQHLPLYRIIITESRGSVGERDRVHPRERDAVEEELRARSVPWERHDGLVPALEGAWEASRPGDGILLFGAQGMDDGWRLLQRIAAR